jgi:hypothetical protein
VLAQGIDVEVENSFRQPIRRIGSAPGVSATDDDRESEEMRAKIAFPDRARWLLFINFFRYRWTWSIVEATALMMNSIPESCGHKASHADSPE